MNTISCLSLKKMMVTVLLAIVCLAAGQSHAFPPKGTEEAELKQMLSQIHWLGHDSFRIDGKGAVIYLDPYKLEDGPKADLILITHEHGDHASPEDVARIRKDDTVIVTIAGAAGKFSGEIRIVKPGDVLILGVGPS